MSLAADLSDIERAPGAAPDADWARPLLERQIALVGELAEDGFEVSRLLKEKIRAAEEVEAAERLALAYARATRAVRLAVLLQEKLIRDLLAQGSRPSADLDPPAVAERKDKVSRIMDRVIDREHGGDIDRRQARERLDRDFCGDILTRPVSELVALICKDLGLKPKWARLAQEAWAEAEMAGGAPGEPLRPFCAPPPEPPEADSAFCDRHGAGRTRASPDPTGPPQPPASVEADTEPARLPERMPSREEMGT